MILYLDWAKYILFRFLCVGIFILVLMIFSYSGSNQELKKRLVIMQNILEAYPQDEFALNQLSYRLSQYDGDSEEFKAFLIEQGILPEPPAEASPILETTPEESR